MKIRKDQVELSPDLVEDFRQKVAATGQRKSARVMGVGLKTVLKILSGRTVVFKDTQRKMKRFVNGEAPLEPMVEIRRADMINEEESAQLRDLLHDYVPKHGGVSVVQPKLGLSKSTFYRVYNGKPITTDTYKRVLAFFKKERKAQGKPAQAARNGNGTQSETFRLEIDLSQENALTLLQRCMEANTSPLEYAKKAILQGLN